MIKLAVCDLDCTITREDTLDLLCRAAGEHAYELSRRINDDYINGRTDGRTALVRRFGLLEGMDTGLIAKLLGGVAVTDGAEAFFAKCRQMGIHTIIESGNLDCVLRYYKELLGFDDFSCSHVPQANGALGSSLDPGCRFVKKGEHTLEYMRENGISKEEVIAVGDSSSDAPLFRLAGRGFIVGERVSAEPGVINVPDFIIITEYLGSD